MARYLTILLCLVSAVLQGQDFKQALTEKHLQKVLQTENAVLKLRKYKRFFHRDSIKQARQVDRYWQAKTDSLYRVIAAREKAVARKLKPIKDHAASKIYRTIYEPWARKQAERQINILEQTGLNPSPMFISFLKSYFRDYFLQATQNDSMLVALKAQLPSLPLPKQLSSKVRDFQLIHPRKTINIEALAKGKLNGIKGVKNMRLLQDKAARYNNQVNQYSQYGKLLQNADTLKAFAKAEGEKIAMNHLSKTEQFTQVNELKKYQGELDKLKGMPGQYKTQVEQLQDSAYIKEQSKKQAEEFALNYVTEHPEIMQSIQKKMNLLMKKYSVVPNSNDLSTAIKRSSLRGMTFRERLVFSGNFQVLSWDPFTIDASPSIGYKFNRYFALGVGGNYRQTFSTDTIPKLAPEVLGYKAFVSYDLFRNFFACGEFDRNSPGMNTEEDKSSRIWRNAAFAGMGRKIRIHSKVEMIILMMYNFMHKLNDPIYPRPFVIRIGFQTSETAMLKRRYML